MLDIIRDDLEELKNYYIQSEANNSLIMIEIRDEEVILEKDQVIQILEILINQNNIDTDEIDYILETLRNSGNSSHEISTINRLQRLTKEYELDTQFNIKQIKENPIFNDIKHKHWCIMNQCSHYDSFKYNQNHFDNLISLLKIVQRLKNENIKIELKDFKYKTEDTNITTAENYKNKILEEGLKGFALMKFII